MNPPDLKYTSEHEWVRMDGEEAVIGITEFAQDQLGDVVYVELPGNWRTCGAEQAVWRGRIRQDARRTSTRRCPVR